MNNQKGFSLFATLTMLMMVMGMMAAYFNMAKIEGTTTRLSSDSANGFYAAEAGLNIRAEIIRNIFVGYNRPEGTSPDDDDACESGNMGDGDFACESHTFGKYEVDTYVLEDPSNPVILTIPPGERYQNLNAQEYRYTVKSVARNVEGRVASILELKFKSRLVPLFQFTAFYDKDLEILPGPTMVLSGPIHTNGDLYLNANNRLEILGQVTTAGDLYRGRKNDNSCMSRPVKIFDPVTGHDLLPSCPSRTLIDEDDIEVYNNMVEIDVDTVTVPEPESLDPTSSQIYFNKADLRLVLRLTATNIPDTSNSLTGVEIRDIDGNLDAGLTNALDACAGSIGGRVANASNTFYNNREGDFIRMLEVDMEALLDCAHTSGLLGFGKILSDDTEGGLVFYMTVAGPNSLNQQSFYGVRIRNARELQSNIGGAPEVKGLTVVSNQAVYTHGDYNAVDKIPAAILCDAFNPLSNNWNLNDSASTSWGSRNANDTVFNAAILSGTNTTGGAEGAGGQGGAYNGGLENYPRFHENWSGDEFTYRGSFVSLDNSRYNDGAWKYGSPQYTAPIRNWDYDTDFNDASKLPPITPRFVYLRQELFVRKYE